MLAYLTAVTAHPLTFEAQAASNRAFAMYFNPCSSDDRNRHAANAGLNPFLPPQLHQLMGVVQSGEDGFMSQTGLCGKPRLVHGPKVCHLCLAVTAKEHNIFGKHSLLVWH